VRGADEAVCGAAHLTLPGAVAPGPLPLPPVGRVWTAPLVQGGERENFASVRLRSCVRPVWRGTWPLAQMGSAIHSQTEK
jgi:hypothetical protein